MSRTQRQDQIRGWDGDELRKKKLCIVGSGPIAQFTLSYLAGLGVENIVLLDDEWLKDPGLEDFLTLKRGSESRKVWMIAKKITDVDEGLNPKMKLRYHHFWPSYPVLSDCDIVADLTNKGYFKKLSEKACFKSGRTERYINALSDESSCYVNIHDTRKSRVRRGYLETIVSGKLKKKEDRDKKYERYFEKKQGITTSAIAACVVVDEIRKYMMPLDYLDECDLIEDFRNKKTRKLHLPNEEPFVYTSGPAASRFRKLNALVVGAGGIGTYAALNLALTSTGRITIADNDHVTESNLNRQILYSPLDIGMNKAETLCDKLSKINPNIDFSPYSKKVTKDSSLDFSSYDIVFSCVDSATSRSELSDICVDYNMPLVNGGVSPFRAQVEFFVPWQTPCLKCQNSGYAKEIENECGTSAPVSCADVGEPSIVVTNALAGALMVSEGHNILSGDTSKLNKKMIYNSSKDLPYISVVSAGRPSGTEDGCRCRGGRI